MLEGSTVILPTSALRARGLSGLAVDRIISNIYALEKNLRYVLVAVSSNRFLAVEG